MQSLHDLSHLEIIFQKAQSHISMVLFVAQHSEVEPTPIYSIHSYAEIPIHRLKYNISLTGPRKHRSSIGHITSGPVVEVPEN